MGLCINDDVEHTYKRFLIARKFDVVRAPLPFSLRRHPARQYAVAQAHRKRQHSGTHTHLTPDSTITANTVAILSPLVHEPPDAGIPTNGGS